MGLSEIKQIAAKGWLYDGIQKLAGVDAVHGRLRRQLPAQNGISSVVDIGGGTGLVRKLLTGTPLYVCIDIEAPKLERLRDMGRGGQGILADAAQLPLRSDSIDLAFCVMVAHHLNDATLKHSLREIARVLRPGARLLFVDPLWRPSRLPGRLLWKLDRGSYPRTAEKLLAALGSELRVTHHESFAVFHEYLLAVCTSK